MARGFKIGGSIAIGGNAEPSDIFINKIAYVNGNKVIGSMQDNGSYNNTINSVSSEITIPVGYHNGLGKIKINTTDQAKIIASNIKKNVVILGTTGSLVTGTDTSDANAVAGNILSGKSGYVKGVKINGSIGSQAAKTVTPSASAQTAVSAGVYCSGNITVGAIPNQKGATTITPSTSQQTAANAGTYMTGALTLGAIPNQTTGGTKYATTSAQTILAANNYLTSDLKIGALSQSNLSSDNILRGKTITINNGSANVWSVTGSNSILIWKSLTMTASTTRRTFYRNDSDTEDFYVATANPGMTPVIAFIRPSEVNYTCGIRNGASAWNLVYFPNNSGQWDVYVNNNKNSAWRFTSSAIDIPSHNSSGTFVLEVFGY